MGRLNPAFNINNIQQIFDDFIQSADEKVFESLQYIGEQFVNEARAKGTYTDRTGNLRSSIGYLILHNGEVVDQNFQGSQEDGVSKARNFASDLAGEYPDGFVLIGVAGMEYAAAVESKGYDVITGSAPVRASLIDLINAIKI